MCNHNTNTFSSTFRVFVGKTLVAQARHNPQHWECSVWQIPGLMSASSTYIVPKMTTLIFATKKKTWTARGTMNDFQEAEDSEKIRTLSFFHSAILYQYCGGSINCPLLQLSCPTYSAPASVSNYMGFSHRRAFHTDVSKIFRFCHGRSKKSVRDILGHIFSGTIKVVLHTDGLVLKISLRISPYGAQALVMNCLGSLNQQVTTAASSTNLPTTASSPHNGTFHGDE